MSYQDACDYSLDVMSLHEEKDRLLLYLSYAQDGSLKDLECDILDESQLLKIDPQELKVRKSRLAASRKALSKKDTYRFR